ncbi:MAG: RNA-binding S4 domain-containing protein [Firmicutes bacterium]|nr:RNA-binding S4 domain-containing protein [Bacillota bacterium]
MEEHITISTETIKLEQLLKLAGVTGTGGQAKLLIQAGEVLVNGLDERRRGRQLRAGDLVEVKGRGRLRVVQG